MSAADGARPAGMASSFYAAEIEKVSQADPLVSAEEAAALIEQDYEYYTHKKGKYVILIKKEGERPEMQATNRLWVAIPRYCYRCIKAAFNKGQTVYWNDDAVKELAVDMTATFRRAAIDVKADGEKHERLEVGLDKYIERFGKVSAKLWDLTARMADINKTTDFTPSFPTVEDLPSTQIALKKVHGEYETMERILQKIENPEESLLRRVRSSSTMLKRVALIDGVKEENIPKIDPHLADLWKMRVNTALYRILSELKESIQKDLKIENPSAAELKEYYRKHDRIAKILREMAPSLNKDMQTSIEEYSLYIDQIKAKYVEKRSSEVDSNSANVQHHIDAIAGYRLSRDALHERIAAYEKEHAFLGLTLPKLKTTTIRDFEQRLVKAKHDATQKYTDNVDKVDNLSRQVKSEIDKLEEVVRLKTEHHERLIQDLKKERKAWLAGLKAAYSKKAQFSKDGETESLSRELSQNRSYINPEKFIGRLGASLNDKQLSECYSAFKEAFMKEAPESAKVDCDKLFASSKSFMEQLKSAVTTMGGAFKDSPLTKLKEKTQDRAIAAKSVEDQKQAASNHLDSVKTQHPKATQIKREPKKAVASIERDLEAIKALEKETRDLKELLNGLKGDPDKEEESLRELEKDYKAQIEAYKQEKDEVAGSIYEKPLIPETPPPAYS